MAWKKVAKDTVALLSAEAGRHAYDRRLSDLNGELSTRSDEFVSGGRSDVQILSLSRSHWPADPSQMLLTYTAEPGSTSQHAPRVSWPAGPRPSTSVSRSMATQAQCHRARR
jgi:transcription regulator MmyB-like protein